MNQVNTIWQMIKRILYAVAAEKRLISKFKTRINIDKARNKLVDGLNPTNLWISIIHLKLRKNLRTKAKMRLIMIREVLNIRNH